VVASSITGEIPIKLFDSFVGLFVLAVTSAEIRAFAAYFSDLRSVCALVSKHYDAWLYYCVCHSVPQTQTPPEKLFIVVQSEHYRV
jgi:hypothetical protein